MTKIPNILKQVGVSPRDRAILAYNLGSSATAILLLESNDFIKENYSNIYTDKDLMKKIEDLRENKDLMNQIRWARLELASQ